jgi:hypothetical protein
MPIVARQRLGKFSYRYRGKEYTRDKRIVERVEYYNVRVVSRKVGN